MAFGWRTSSVSSPRGVVRVSATRTLRTTDRRPAGSAMLIDAAAFAALVIVYFVYDRAVTRPHAARDGNPPAVPPRLRPHPRSVHANGVVWQSHKTTGVKPTIVSSRPHGP